MKQFIDRIYTLPNATDRFPAMEGLRAYAALLIFIVHYFDTFSRSILGIDLNTQTLGSVQDPVTGAVFYLFASHYGVDLFFFLSGFLIYRIVSRSGFSYPVFVKRRLLRIYPTFLASLFVWACVRIPIHHAYPFDLTQLLGNLMFLNAIPALGITPYNAVTWSLFYEFVFYLLFPAILLLPGHKRSLGPWHVIGFGILFIYVAMNINPYLIRFMMFFGGALMASLRPKQLAGLALRIPDSLVIVCYLASTAWFSFLLSYQKFIPVFLVTSFLLVLKVLYGNGLLNRIFMLRWFRYLGNISYSFYLLHGLAIELVMGHLAKYFMKLGMTAYLVFTFGLALLLAVVFSTVLFLLTEKPYFTRKQHDFSAREGVGATA